MQSPTLPPQSPQSQPQEETREMQSPTLPPQPQPQPQEETREMQSPTLPPQPQLQEETREMQSPTLPPQPPQSPQPQPEPPQPTPASPTPSRSQPSSASSSLPPPNPSPPSLPPSPDPKLPSGNEISSSSPSPPHPFSSTALPSSSSLSGGMLAHHPSPPPPKPASSKILAILRKMKIDVILAIMNILAQAASVILDLLATRFLALCSFLGFIFALLAVLFAIGELWWMRKRKAHIGALEYAESVMAILQLAGSSFEFLRWKNGSFPFVEYSGSLLLALIVGYYKVAKMVGRWHPLETDGNSLIVIRVDSLETAPREVGKWIYDNRIQDVKWGSADSLARFFGAQQS